MIYTYSPVCTVFDASISITWASGRGLGPGNLNFFGLKIELTVLGPRKGYMFRAQPPPTCPRNGSALIKNITHGAVIMYMSLRPISPTSYFRIVEGRGGGVVYCIGVGVGTLVTHKWWWWGGGEVDRQLTADSTRSILSVLLSLSVRTQKKKIFITKPHNGSSLLYI
jgi:hypothetical protein